ncbi:hypothetical protein [Streptomyces sp. NPDC090025]|uniref:hypothetical protein n=1 Tax=Streptomyces sp. NPDC090025 TaxID=3365922 RepID=UPI0038355C6C
MKYLTTLAGKVGRERFEAEFAKVTKVEVTKVSDNEPRAPRQPCSTAAKRLARAKARPLISALAGR